MFHAFADAYTEHVQVKGLMQFLDQRGQAQPSRFELANSIRRLTPRGPGASTSTTCCTPFSACLQKEAALYSTASGPCRKVRTTGLQRRPDLPWSCRPLKTRSANRRSMVTGPAEYRLVASNHTGATATVSARTLSTQITGNPQSPGSSGISALDCGQLSDWKTVQRK